MRLSPNHINLLKWVNKTSKRPDLHSNEWDLFIELSNNGLVDDCGGGSAKLTPRGKFDLKEAKRSLAAKREQPR